MSRERGPYETLVKDPGEEPSPSPTHRQRAIDLARTIHEYRYAAPVAVDENSAYFEVGTMGASGVAHLITLLHTGCKFLHPTFSHRRMMKTRRK